MNHTILIVEDDEVLGQVLCRVLRQQGYAVRLATTAAQALDLARERPPQLALLDLCLPDSDGMQLARELHARDSRLPQILVTAFPLRLREDPAAAALFEAVLTKPLNVRDLRRTVQAALASAAAASRADASDTDRAAVETSSLCAADNP